MPCIAPLNPSIIAIILTCGVAQYESSAALSMHLILDLDVQPHYMVLFWLIAGLPAWFTPIYGILTDSISVGGLRRKPVLVLTSVCLGAVWVATSLVESSAAVLGLASTAAFLSSLQSVALNALIVEQTPTGCDGEMQSRSMIVRSVSSLVGSLTNIALLAYVSLSAVIALSGLWYFAAALASLMAREDVADVVIATESSSSSVGDALLSDSDSTTSSAGEDIVRLERGPRNSSSRTTTPRPTEAYDTFCDVAVVNPDGCSHNRCFGGTSTACGIKTVKPIALRHSFMSWVRMVQRLIRNPGVLGSVVFVFIYAATPDPSMVYSSYVATHFSYKPAMLSVFNACGLVGGVAGSYAYSRRMVHWSMRLCFAVGTLCYALSCLSNLLLVLGVVQSVLHMPPYVFIPLDQFATTFFSRLSYIPVPHLASQSCPVGMEAAIFELFTCMSFAGGTLSATILAALSSQLGLTNTQWDALWLLIVVCACLRLLSGAFVLLVPRRVERPTLNVD
eukprot:PhM_4_TR18094/c6_g2_i1/m.49197